MEPDDIHPEAFQVVQVCGGQRAVGIEALELRMEGMGFEDSIYPMENPVPSEGVHEEPIVGVHIDFVGESADHKHQNR